MLKNKKLDNVLIKRRVICETCREKFKPYYSKDSEGFPILCFANCKQCIKKHINKSEYLKDLPKMPLYQTFKGIIIKTFEDNNNY